MKPIKLNSILSKRNKRSNFRNKKKSVKFKKKIVIEFPIPKRGKSRPLKSKHKILDTKTYNRRSSRFSRKLRPYKKNN